MAKQAVSKSALVAQLLADPEILTLLKSQLGGDKPKPAMELKIEHGKDEWRGKAVQLHFGGKPRFMLIKELEHLLKPETIAQVKSFIAKQ